MKFTPTPLAGSYTISLDSNADERGWFGRYYCKKEFQAIGHVKEWVQLNHSFTSLKGSLRGMHFQVAPFTEIKMVKCVAGSVFDVIIDLRKGSETFLKWFGTEISSANNKMVYIPEGFAHGFQCLEDNCGLIYHHTEYYTPGAEAGIRYDDPLVQIEWPLKVSLLSPRDQQHPFLEKTFKGI